MLFHLFIFFSHMNWSIHSYSAGKFTIRMRHVHICKGSYSDIHHSSSQFLLQRFNDTMVTFIRQENYKKMTPVYIYSVQGV